jgi:hypothetical protein
MNKKSIDYIQENKDFLKIEFWNQTQYKYKLCLNISITGFFIIIAILNLVLDIQKIFQLDWLITGLILIGFPFILTLSEYSDNYYPWVLTIDVKKQIISCSGIFIRLFTYKYNLQDLEKVDITQFSEKESLKELVSFKAQKNLFVKRFSFHFGQRSFSVLKITATVEEWVLLLNKINELFKNNNYSVRIPEIE